MGSLCIACVRVCVLILTLPSPQLAQDITLKGLRIVKSCSKVYIEAYTSILTVPRARLEELFGKPIEEAPREFVEGEIEGVLEQARSAILSQAGSSGYFTTTYYYYITTT